MMLIYRMWKNFSSWQPKNGDEDDLTVPSEVDIYDKCDLKQVITMKQHMVNDESSNSFGKKLLGYFEKIKVKMTWKKTEYRVSARDVRLSAQIRHNRQSLRQKEEVLKERIGVKVCKYLDNMSDSEFQDFWENAEQQDMEALGTNLADQSEDGRTFENRMQRRLVQARNNVEEKVEE